MRTGLVFALLVGAAGCRSHFDVIHDAAPLGDTSTDSTDAAACTFGTVTAEYLFPDVRAGVYDSNRIVALPTGVVVAVTLLGAVVELQAFDFQLVPTGSRRPLMTAGNMGLSHDASAGTLVGYDVASGNSQLLTYTDDGATLVTGPTATGTNNGSGFIDANGNIHLVNRIGPGMREYTAVHAFVRAWGVDAPAGGLDAALDRARNRAWIATTTGIAAYDLATVTREFVVMLPGVATADDGDAVVVDDLGTVYVANRSTATIFVIRDSAIVDMRSYAGEDPVTLEWEPTTRRLLVGFLEGETTRARALCPYVP